MSKILITGAKGQLGKKLIEILGPKYQLILTDTAEMDITDKKMVESVIGQEKPDFIIHAAAYTKVDDAETQREIAYKVNALGTKNLAEVAKQNNIPLLYISTDYVFSGKGAKPLTEKDRTNPVNYYGETKLAGENFIRQICEKYYILRSAWLYGELPEGHPGSNFVETMLKLAQEKPELNVVSDQIGSPTYTEDLVLIIKEIIDRQFNNLTIQQFNNKLPYGIYHVSGEGEASWFDFAKEIFRLSNITIKVNPVGTEAFPRPAKRPKYSYLSKARLANAGIKIRPWQEALKEYLASKPVSK